MRHSRVGEDGEKRRHSREVIPRARREAGGRAGRALKGLL